MKLICTIRIRLDFFNLDKKGNERERKEGKLRES